MLAYLRGTVQAKEMTGGAGDRLVIEVAGVGFELAVPRRTLLKTGQVGDTATIFTSLVIRESDWTLFGFATAEEREMFTLIQSVSGIGPKLALSLVGTLGPDELAEAIVAEDEKAISQAPGVGAKVARRLILELRGKMEEHSSRHGLVEMRATTGAGFEEARAILAGLGYTVTEINQALSEAPTGEDVESLVRHSLRFLGSAARP